MSSILEGEGREEGAAEEEEAGEEGEAMQNSLRQQKINSKKCNSKIKIWESKKMRKISLFWAENFNYLFSLQSQ